MVNATTGAHSKGPADLISKHATSAKSVVAFAKHLATEVEAQSGKTGQNSGARQITAAPKDLKSSTPAASPAATGPSLMAATMSEITTPAATVKQISTPAPADKSKMTPDQAYWAEQPPAVQALQSLPDDQKMAAAQVLANQGYSIDVPIMVWGWDPLATMTVRQNDGLTWVPSALQPNIPVAPGDSFPGLASYDPNSPPPGSIAVTTDFAIGTNGQNPWVKLGA